MSTNYIGSFFLIQNVNQIFKFINHQCEDKLSNSYLRFVKLIL
jgi:hypothetical protein